MTGMQDPTAPNRFRTAPAARPRMLLGIALLLLLVPRSGFALGGIQVVPADPTVAVTTSHQVDFTTAEKLKAGDSIHIDYPAGFDLGSVALVGSSGFPGTTLSLSVSGQTVVVTCNGADVSPGPKTLILSPVGEPTAATSYVITLSTIKKKGDTLEAGKTSAPFALVAVEPDHFLLQPSASSFVAGDTLALRVDTFDPYGNPSSPSSDHFLDLLSSSPSGSFHLQAGGAAVDSVLLPADSTGVDFYYRDIHTSENPITLTVLDASSPPTLGFDRAVVSLTAAAVDSVRSSVSATSPVTADGISITAVSVVLRDAFDNPVAAVDSASIVLTLDAPQYAVDKNGAASATDGSFTAGLRTLWAGSWTLQVDAAGVALAQRPQVAFDPRPVDSLQSTLVAGGPAVADGLDPIAVDLVLRDGAGRPVSGVDSSRVVLIVLDGPAAVDKLTPKSAADGSFSAQLRSTVSGPRRVTAVIAGVALTDTASVTFTPGPVDPFRSSVTAGGPAVADGVDSLQLAMVLRDAFDNPVAAVDSASIGIAVLDAAVDKVDSLSAADGGFSAYLRSTVAGSRPVTVSVNGTVLNDQPTVVFRSAGVDSAQSTLSATGPAVADGIDAVRLDLTLRDAWSNPVAGVDSSRISLSGLASWTIEKLDAQSDSSGVFHLRLLSTVSGEAIAQASVDGSMVAAPVLVRFVPGPLDHFFVDLPNGPSTPAGVAARLLLEARDAFDNRLDGHLGTVRVIAATGGDGSNLGWNSLGTGTLISAGATAVDYAFAAADSGRVLLQLSDTRAETLLVDATEGTATGGISLRVTVAEPALLTLKSGDAQTAEVATTVPVPLQVMVTDAFGNPVTNEPIDFIAADGGRADIDPATPGDQATALSGPDGVAVCPVWQLGPLSGIQHLAALASFGVQVGFTADAQPGPLAQLLLEPSGPQDLTVSTSTVVAARALDAFGNAISGMEVTIFASDTLDGILAGVGETDSLGLSQQRGWTGADGRVSVAYTSPPLAGTVDVLDAAAAGVPATAVTDLVFTAVEGSASAIVLNLPAGSTRAGVEGSFQVQLLDDFGNVVSGGAATVRLSAPGTSGLTFAAASGGPYSSTLDLPVVGSRSVFFRGSFAGSHAFTAVDTSGVLTAASGTLTIIASDVAASFQLTYPSSAPAGQTFTLRVDAFDAWGNPAVDAADTFTLDLVDAVDSTLLTGVPLQVSRGDLVSGFFQTDLERVDRAGSYRVRLTSASSQWFGPPLQVDPAGAWRLAVVGPDSLSGVIAGNSVDFTVEVLDAFDNPVGGEPLDVVLLEGGILELASSVSNAQGRGRFRLRTDARVGTARLRIGILDHSPLQRETALLVAETVAGPVASLTITPALTQAEAGQGFTFLVRAFDAAGNPAESANDLVDFSATGSGVTITPLAANLAGGQVSATVVDTLAESFFLDATLAASPSITGRSGVITVVAASPFRIVALGDTLSTAPSGSPVPLAARVEDRFANPVASVPVRLALRQAPAGASLVDPFPPTDDGLAQTDSLGTLFFTLRLSPLSGTHRVEAAILDGSPAQWEKAQWRVDGVAGAVDHLALTLSADTLVAGQATGLQIRLEDAAGNLVAQDGEVALTAPGFNFSTLPAPVVLSQGVATVSLSVFTAGDFALDAAFVPAPAVIGAAGPFPVLPANASGVIPIALVSPPENTANGIAVTRVVTGSIRDAWNNVVAEGTAVDVTASGGAILSDDLDPSTPGVQRRTDASGQVDLRLVAPFTPGPVDIDFSSGTASGRATALFAAMASLSPDGNLSPAVTVPGRTVSFTLPVRNDGEVDALLDPAQSVLRIDGGGGVVVTAQLAAPQTVLAGASTLLAFAPVTLPDSLTPGSYAPVLELRGNDEHGQPVTAFLVLENGALVVDALVIRSVSQPLSASVGDTLDVRVDVENLGSVGLELSQLSLRSSPTADFPVIAQDPLPVTLPAGANITLHTRLRVGAATPVGSYRFIARASGSLGGTPFVAPEDSSLVPLAIQTASNLEIVAVEPAVMQLGDSLALQVTVRNRGGLGVTLEAAASRAQLSGGGWSSPLSGPVAIAPQEQTQLLFLPTLLAPSLGSGSRDLLLHLEGSEGVSALLVDLVAPGALLLQTPAVVTLGAVPLDPSAALRSSTVVFRLSLDNAGEATVVLDPALCALRLGEPGGTRLSAPLDPSAGTQLVPGSNLLGFVPITLPPDLLLGDPVGVVQLRGTQNGVPYALDLPLPVGSLRLEDPAGLRILSTEALNPRAPRPEVDAGQRIGVRVVVGNAGGDAVDSLRVRLEGTAVPASSAPEIFRARLAGGAVDTLLFDLALTPTPGPETLWASIVQAVSPITGGTILPEPPLDDLATLVVQRPVTLAFSARWVDSPDSLDRKVSPGQIFTLQLSLDRDHALDPQGDWLPTQVDLGGLGAFTLVDSTVLPVVLDPDRPQATVALRAPAGPASTNLVARLVRVDLDANDPAARPLTTPDSVSLRVSVNGDVVFSQCELREESPSGARDGIVSTGQLVTVQGLVQGPANLQQRELELLVPPSFALVGGASRQALAAGDSTASWQLRCPDLPAVDQALQMVVYATDVQSGNAVADTCASLVLQVVDAARAVPRLRIVAPLSASQRGEIPPDAVVELEGGFDLSGTAAAVGPARLGLELPPGFILLDGTSAALDLASPDSVVTWRVQGPSRLDLGIQTLTVRAEIPPNDENTGLPAAGSNGAASVSLTILADPLSLQVADLDSVGSLVGADRPYPRVAFLLRNGLTTAADFHRLDLEVVDDAGRPIADPSVFLQSLTLVREDTGESFSATVTANPVTIQLSTSIATAAAIGFRLDVQARRGAPFASFAFAVDRGSAELTETGGFPLSYALLDGEGSGEERVIAGASVTVAGADQVSAHSYPNPFVPSREDAILAYSLPEDAPVRIEIFDLLGQVVKSWDFPPGSPQSSAGIHDGDVRWDGRNGRGEPVRNGVYVCRLQAAGREVIYRIAVTR